MVGFPDLGLLRTLRPHTTGISRRRTFPADHAWNPWSAGTSGGVPTFTIQPIDGIGTQLYSCILAIATPQAFTMASRTGDILRSGSSLDWHTSLGLRCNPTPIHQISSRWSDLRSVRTLVPMRVPLRRVSRARPIWQYWNRLGVVRAASRPRSHPGVQAALNFTWLLRQPGGGGLSPPLGSTAPRGAQRRSTTADSGHQL